MKTGTMIRATVILASVAISACTMDTSDTGSAKSSSVTNDAAEAQHTAAAKLRVPVEKTLHMSSVVLRFIPAGRFVMGTPRSEQEEVIGEDVPYPIAKQHEVILSKAFYLGKYEVTQGQWKKVMGCNPSFLENTNDNAPVECVSWHDCTNFMAQLALLEGMLEGSFRLPTEAQWEYACRAGTTTAFCYGDDLDSSMANFHGNYPFGAGRQGEYRGKTVSAGQFKPNAWGLYDMHGNVWEWCLDWYELYHGNATNPCGPNEGSDRVIRGGCWFSHAKNCRSAERNHRAPDSGKYPVGLRLCLPADQ